MRLGDQIVATQVDTASLAAFRILFGLTMAAGAIRFLSLGWVDEFYVQPVFHVTWDFFPWVRPLPASLMHWHFVALAVAACGIAVGFQYRVCAAAFFLGFTYVELIDKTTYLNHYYLVSLLSFLLVFLPAHHAWSVDAWRRSTPFSPAIPSWSVNVLRFQIALVYLFAGLAKINADWLLEAQPLRMWLAARSDLPLLGPFFMHEWVPYAFSWCGAAYDLTIVLFLLWRPTRSLAYVTAIAFHAMTWFLFPIGMFPWIMLVATTVFFSPDWPRRCLERFSFLRNVPPQADRCGPAEAARYAQATSGLGACPRGDTVTFVAVPLRTLVCLALFAAVQIAVPLRGYRPGMDPDWTNRGFNFAWRVMLVEKSGFTQLVARDPATGQKWTVRLRDYVTERQEMMLVQDPFMVRALARHIGARLRDRFGVAVEVRAESFASLNGRPAQRLIDPRVDLAGPGTNAWIVPLNRGREPSSADVAAGADSELRTLAFSSSLDSAVALGSEPPRAPRPQSRSPHGTQ